jgi:hypothetical protein
MIAVALAIGAGTVMSCSAGASASAAVAPRATEAVPAAGTLRASERKIYPGDRVTFTGQLGTRLTEQRLALQVYRNGNWKRIESRYAGRAGRFRLPEYLDYPAGTYKFRVVGLTGYLTPQARKTRTPTVRVIVEDRPGSFARPWHPGQTFQVARWQVRFDVTDADAWPEAQAAAWRTPPPPGWSYIGVSFAFTRVGPGSAPFWFDNSLSFVGGDGVVYGSSSTVSGTTYRCELAGDWSTSPELYPGASGSATRCLPVPTAAIAGGMWRLSDAEFDSHHVTAS